MEKCIRCGEKLNDIERHRGEPQKAVYFLHCPKCGTFEASDVEIAAKQHLENK